MHRRLASIALRRTAVALFVMTLLAGCAQINDWMRLDRSNTRSNGVILGAPDTEQYVEEMYRMASGDPATQAEIFADADAAATLTPGPSTRLRLALILSVPGHAESGLERAQDLFRDLLSQSELLTPGEIALATIHLRNVEQRLLLTGETVRLRAESDRLASSERRAVERRLNRVVQENRELRESLTTAEEKLEAITSIERSIREQADDDGDN